MDLDIEMDDAVETAQDVPVADIPVGDDILQPDEPDEPGEVAEEEGEKVPGEAATLVPNKIHIRGLDSLHTDDIKAYVKAHFGSVDRVEWIDDGSANLNFSSEPTARDALLALTTVPIADATALAVGEFLPAKPLAAKPEVSLQVRFAVASDKKQAGAALRSRYYLLHPEHDPETRRRNNQENRSRYRDRDDNYGRGGRRRRRSDDEVETYEASMYDDAPRATRERRASDASDLERRYARDNNRGKELFTNRRPRRDRSASPMRDADGDDDLITGRPSSLNNRVKARSIQDRLSTSQKTKDLFADKTSGDGGARLDQLERAIGSAHLKEEDRPKIVATPDSRSRGSLNIRGMATQQSQSEGFAIKGAAAASARELFPNKLGGDNSGKELFDSSRTKRRQKAEDLFS